MKLSLVLGAVQRRRYLSASAICRKKSTHRKHRPSLDARFSPMKEPKRRSLRSRRSGLRARQGTAVQSRQIQRDGSRTLCTPRYFQFMKMLRHSGPPKRASMHRSALNLQSDDSSTMNKIRAARPHRVTVIPPSSPGYPSQPRALRHSARAWERGKSHLRGKDPRFLALRASGCHGEMTHVVRKADRPLRPCSSRAGER